MRSQEIPPPAQPIEIFGHSRRGLCRARGANCASPSCSGRQYAYANVPPSIYDAFLASSSKGAFFNIAIRGRYQFHEILPHSEPVRH